MKNIILILTLFIFISEKPSKNNLCESYKSGTFISEDENYGRTTIQRYGNMQLSENKTIGSKSLERISWIDSCTYKIFDIKLLEDKNNISSPSGNIIVTLERINDSTFYQKVYLEQIDFEHISKATKISDDVSDEFKKMIEN